MKLTDPTKPIAWALGLGMALLVLAVFVALAISIVGVVL